MKVKTKIEFLIHVDSYRSVDLISFQEGLIHLRFSIFSYNDVKKRVNTTFNIIYQLSQIKFKKKYL
jgi:hypothetical protein